jgi:hypothetical protein
MTRAQPQVVAGYSRRGLVGPNVKSGIFAKGLQDFAKQRARTFSEFDQGQKSNSVVMTLVKRNVLKRLKIS